MPTNARRRHRIGTGGPWGTGLLILGVAVLVQGLGYMTARPSRLPGALEELSEYVPPWVWGGLWVAAGCWSVWKALTPPQQHWEILPIVGVLSLWSAAYLIWWALLGFVQGDWTRGWMSAAGWGMLAAYTACMGRCVNPPLGIR